MCFGGSMFEKHVAWFILFHLFVRKTSSTKGLSYLFGLVLCFLWTAAIYKYIQYIYICFSSELWSHSISRLMCCLLCTQGFEFEFLYSLFLAKESAAWREGKWHLGHSLSIAKPRCGTQNTEARRKQTTRGASVKCEDRPCWKFHWSTYVQPPTRHPIAQCLPWAYFFLQCLCLHVAQAENQRWWLFDNTTECLAILQIAGDCLGSQIL